jgi:glycosyltransferase involved in cell wall biosynthesis
MSLRVAFSLIGGRRWTGGYHYLLNLVRSVAAHAGDRVTPVMLFGADVAPTERAPFEALPGIELIEAPAMARGRRQLASLRALVLGNDPPVRRLIRAHGIDAVFEADQFLGWRCGAPVIAWIPDFQHRSLPQNFPWYRWWRRDLAYRIQARCGRAMMLSSEDARRVCEKHYPASRGRTHVVHFSVTAPDLATTSQRLDVRRAYGLPERFLYMPNQFWRHKNHLVVTEALELLGRRGRSDVVVAASGKQLDAYAPDHARKVVEQVRRLGLEQRFRLLGEIPYEHVGVLMQACDALLNPSSCEGWSTTVEEARSVGTPLLLSDLAVHHEQAGPDAHYFDPGDAGALARALENFMPLPPAVRKSREDHARKASVLRSRAFGERFAALAEACARGAAR